MVAKAIVMVGMLLGQSVLLHAAYKTAVAHMPNLAISAAVPSGSFLLLIATMPFLLLTLLMASVHILRLALFWLAKRDARNVDFAKSTQTP
jgi:hypothetical protein